MRIIRPWTTLRRFRHVRAPLQRDARPLCPWKHRQLSSVSLRSPSLIQNLQLLLNVQSTIMEQPKRAKVQAQNDCRSGARRPPNGYCYRNCRLRHCNPLPSPCLGWTGLVSLGNSRGVYMHTEPLAPVHHYLNLSCCGQSTLGVGTTT